MVDTIFDGTLRHSAYEVAARWRMPRRGALGLTAAPPEPAHDPVWESVGVIDAAARQGAWVSGFTGGDWVLDVDDTRCVLGRVGAIRADADVAYVDNPLWLVDVLLHVQRIDRLTAALRAPITLPPLALATASRWGRPRRWMRRLEVASLQLRITRSEPPAVAVLQLEGGAFRLRLTIGDRVDDADRPAGWPARETLTAP